MPNPNYAKGAEAERHLVRVKRAEGYAAWRTAGSHSACDVIACRKGTIELHQLKTGRRRWPSRDERFALKLEAHRAGATPYIVFREPRKGFEFVGLEDWPPS